MIPIDGVHLQTHCFVLIDCLKEATRSCSAGREALTCQDPFCGFNQMKYFFFQLTQLVLFVWQIQKLTTQSLHLTKDYPIFCLKPTLRLELINYTTLLLSFLIPNLPLLISGIALKKLIWGLSWQKLWKMYWRPNFYTWVSILRISWLLILQR